MSNETGQGTKEETRDGHCCQGKGHAAGEPKGHGQGHCGRHGHEATPADDKAGHAHTQGHTCCRDRD